MTKERKKGKAALKNVVCDNRVKEFSKGILREKVTKNFVPIPNPDKNYVEKVLYRGAEMKAVVYIEPTKNLPEEEKEIDARENGVLVIKKVPARNRLTYIGDAIAMTNCKIAESIIAVANAMSQALERYADIVENKNKLDEYYMLLNDIDQYEITLMDRGHLLDAYSKLELEVQASFEMEDKMICMILKTLNIEGLNKMFALIKSESMGAMQAYICIINSDNFMADIFGYKKMHPTILTGKYAKILVNAMVLAYEHIEIEGISDGYYEVIYNGDRGEARTYKIVPHKHFVKQLVETLYNSITERDLAEMISDDNYIMIKNEIKSINQSIYLSNLRSLHAALRSQVRRYRIEGTLQGKQ